MVGDSITNCHLTRVKRWLYLVRMTLQTSDDLRRWLTRRGWTALELSIELGVSRQRVYQLLDGQTPSLAMAAKLERLTGIPAASWAKEERLA